MELETKSGHTADEEMPGGLVQDELLERLELALARLPERRRMVFMAVRQEGLSYAAVAARTGLSIRQIEREIAAALLQLDDAVAGRVSWRSRICRALFGKVRGWQLRACERSTKAVTTGSGSIGCTLE